MSTFQLSMDCNNAAFTSDRDDSIDEAARARGMEAARILRKAANMLENGYLDGACVDHNGNTVGSWRLT